MPRQSQPTTQYFAFLDTGSGDVSARIQLRSTPIRTPVWTDSTLVLFTEDNLLAVDPAGPELRWGRAAHGRWGSSRPLVHGGAVLAGDSRGRLSAFALQTGTPLWSAEFVDEDLRGLGAHEGVVYVGTRKGTVYAWAVP